MDEIREQLRALLKGGNAHMSFEDAVANFPADFRNSTPPHVDYTPWHLLEHLRITQWDILEFISNPKHISPDWPSGYWPAQDAQADEQAWQQTIIRFAADQQTLLGILDDERADLNERIPHGSGQTVLREMLLVADHNAYHIGEFAILRQVMGTWRNQGH